MSPVEILPESIILTLESASGLLLDLDGTLVDSMGCLESTYFDFLRKFGKTGSREEFGELIGPPLPVVVTTLRERYRLEQDVQSLSTIYNDLMAGNYSLCQPIWGARELLSAGREKGKSLALVTGAHSDIVEGLLKRLDWTACFDAVITGDHCEEHKPSPVPYLKALNSLGLQGLGNCLVIEDSVNGIQAASSAGVPSIGLCRDDDNQALYAAGARHCCENLDSLIALMSRSRGTDK